MGAAQWVRRWTRLVLLGLHFARGLLVATFLFPLQSRERRKREIEHWSMQLLTLLGIRLFLHGTPPPYGVCPLMLVSNHISWLDVFAINAIVPSRFVAKSEVRGWPFVGWLAARAGTLFIHRRKRNDAARVNERVSRALQAGEVFAVFPEGTTSDGSTLFRFHASLVEPALEVEAAVQPIALWYDRSDGTLCTEVAYDGERSMWDVLMGVTSQREVLAHVAFLDPIVTMDRHRRDITHEAQEAIRATLFPAARDPVASAEAAEHSYAL
jgi:1-acyl-sn-glycerol-3-phosphate acyltransferase